MIDLDFKTKTYTLIVVVSFYGIVSLLLTIINYNSSGSDVYDFADITDNWQVGAIMQITVANECPLGYEEAFNYTWPGTKTGCWCGDTSSFNRFINSVNWNLYDKSCFWSKPFAGCTDISPISPVVMDVWAQNEVGNMKLCVQRSQETWLQVAQQSGANCSDSTSKKCGFSSENSFCTNESTCPINNVVITNLTLPDQSDILSNCITENNCTIITQTQTSAKILQYQRGDTTDALPTAQMRLNEYSMCLDSTENDITPGRRDFILLNTLRFTCNSEGAELWNLTDSMTESQLFALNGLTDAISSLEQYGYYAAGEDGNSFNYNLFSRSYVPWSIDCRGDMNNLVASASTIKTFKVLQFVLLIITGLAFIYLAIILPLTLYAMRYDDSPSLEKFGKISYPFVTIPLLCLQIAVLVICKNNKDFFLQLAPKNCSEPLVNQIFSDLAGFLQQTFTFNMINVSVLIFVMIILTLYFFANKPEQEIQQEEESSTLGERQSEISGNPEVNTSLHTLLYH